MSRLAAALYRARPRGRALLCTAAGMAAATVAVAQPNAAGPIEEVVVFGRGTALIGAAGAASEGQVAGADLAVRPLLKVAEVLEAVPGLIAAQHSGTGKANQYFLRGFNLDHGTDFTTYVDDMPWNLRSHGHGQGYLDVNGLMPEVIESIEYRKGPYRASVGDSRWRAPRTSGPWTAGISRSCRSRPASTTGRASLPAARPTSPGAG